MGEAVARFGGRRVSHPVARGAVSHPTWAQEMDELVTLTLGAARWARRSPDLAVAESATPVARGAVSHPKWAQVDEMSQSPWTNHPNNRVRPELGEASAELSEPPVGCSQSPKLWVRPEGRGGRQIWRLQSQPPRSSGCSESPKMGARGRDESVTLD